MNQAIEAVKPAEKAVEQPKNLHWTDKLKGIVLLVFSGVYLNPASPDYVNAAILGVLGVAILW